MSNNKAEEKQSFIAEARRTQIVDAAITTLDEIGYVNASLAQIAKRAGISTALISYHFKDKNDLMDHTLMALLASSTSYVLARTKAENTVREKLHAYISASLAYQGTHAKHNAALLEIVFNARTPENIPYYKLSDDEEEPVMLELKQILHDGQNKGEFRQFNVDVMASAITGAIGEYMLLANPNITAKVDLESYSEELVKIFDKTIVNDD
ncbi:TetR/AcrR family transcriptional regulator [Desulfosporosinus sp. BICA1-9]|uniref:TetR/AcrR family transcriptional regulator n=1 Tax=Desulfosporosinus sp. BICA1-9 TaxID=1531958 RepID=UPI00054B6E91|nr:TetR/AcrR family transcriptional regulator [Desulfosporosinus sp. BICA1-9]KJS49545.1 MAG: transcriptional regulator [Peptococcaceae bacterium BRH_c23]KJS78576.1 MAG: transcriptional regulator [Desulfosporosinus sp. BICA1-9]